MSAWEVADTARATSPFPFPLPAVTTTAAQPNLMAAAVQPGLTTTAAQSDLIATAAQSTSIATAALFAEHSTTTTQRDLIVTTSPSPSIVATTQTTPVTLPMATTRHHATQVPTTVKATPPVSKQVHARAHKSTTSTTIFPRLILPKELMVGPPSIFCFAWTPRRPGDERLLPYVRNLFSACDGHMFFTDRNASYKQYPGADDNFVKVDVPRTKQKRSDGGWLTHKNMIGLTPAWTYLLDNGVAEKYDWVLNAELDHFTRPWLVRRNIMQHLELLGKGNSAQRRSTEGPLMLSWGNAFVFNKKMVQAMAQSWAKLAAPITEDISGMGCPHFTVGRAKSTGCCEQDMAYPVLPSQLTPKAVKYGPEGCSQTQNFGAGKTLPFACWQDFPLGGSEKDAATTFREIAGMRNMSSSEANTYCHTRPKQIVAACQSLYRARDVPIMHNFKDPRLHALAQKLLIP